MVGGTISSDGSDRRFERVVWHGMPAVRIIPSPGDKGRAEAASFNEIGRYLASRAVPVPEIYEFDRDNFHITVEDLGDTLFNSHACGLISAGDKDGCAALYAEAIDMLLEMQAEASSGFDTAWCCDTPLYNSETAFERECMYFLNEFVRGVMDIHYSAGLVHELKEFSSIVDNFPGRIFLHRDFQSRNIMIKGAGLRVIDFQAARLGPAGYDVASLLFDPYVPLWEDLRQSLMDYYIESVVRAGLHPGRNSGDLRFEINVTALLRLMQATGAYSYLSARKKKRFFRRYINPALLNIKSLLDNPAEMKGMLPQLYSLLNRVCEARC